MESNSHINSKQNKFIEIDPNKFILIKVTDQQIYEGRMSLKNITNNYVVFRFFNSLHMTYSITPIVYYIRPYETFVVNIKRFGKSNESENSKITLVAMESENKMTDVNIFKLSD